MAERKRGGYNGGPGTGQWPHLLYGNLEYHGVSGGTGGEAPCRSHGMLFDNHPDIMDFIDAKIEENKLSYFNISVCVSDALLKAVEEEGDFPLISRINGSVAKTVKAKDLWNKLSESAWKTG